MVSVSLELVALMQSSVVAARAGCIRNAVALRESKKISNDQELIQSDPISCPQNQKGNN